MILNVKTPTNDLPSQIVQFKIYQAIRQSLSSSQISFIFSSQSEQNAIVSVLKSMKQSSAYQFAFSYSKTPLIIKQIYHIRFCNLKKLFLQNDCITNIQSLALIDAEDLQTISLNQNRISKMRCLKKQNFPNLQTLTLKQNPISQIKCGESLNLKQLRIEDSAYDKPLGQQDLSYLLKMKGFNLKILRVQSYNRLKTPKFDQMMKNKNTGIWIYRTQTHNTQ